MMKRQHNRWSSWATTIQRTDDPDSPGFWLGDTDLLRIHDPKVRLKARALTQLAHTPTDKVLALHRFVQKLVLARPFRPGFRDSRTVLTAGYGDAEDKACLLVALLRAIRMPARIRYIELDGRILRGLSDTVASASRPVIEVYVGDQWIKTDAFIFDPAYLKAALLALREERWNFGYGVHILCTTSWDAKTHASISGPWDKDNPVFIEALSCYNDPREYAQSDHFKSRHGLAGLIRRKLALSIAGRAIDARIRALRERASLFASNASHSRSNEGQSVIPARVKRQVI